MHLKFIRLLIMRILANINSFLQMNFKFDGVVKISSKSFFSRKLKRTQDIEIRSRSPMKIGGPRSDHISQTFHIYQLPKKRKSDN